LAVDIVCDIAGGEDAGGAGGGGVAFGAILNFNIAVFHVELASEKISVGFVANGDEDAGDIDEC